MQPMVRYRDIRKSFGNTEILRGINLDIAAGEKVALIGPSGSGKTTLGRLLMTLEQPTSGTIEVNGELLWHQQVDGRLVPADMKHIRRIRGQIGMVFQQFNLFPHMTVVQNVMEAPVQVLGVNPQAARERAIALLEKVGLQHRLDSYPAQLSGGQQQRVAIARALAMNPRVLVLDEVTSALDPEMVGEVLSVIREIAVEGEMTMLIITHEMDFAREVADRVVFIDDGQIVEQGPPEDVLTKSENVRLQAFLSRFRGGRT